MSGLRWRNAGGSRGVVEHVVQVVQVRHQVFPEGHLGGTVVVTDARLQADVQVELVMRTVLGPGNLLKTIGLRVDELGVLRNGLVWVSEGRESKVIKL